MGGGELALLAFPPPDNPSFSAKAEGFPLSLSLSVALAAAVAVTAFRFCDLSELFLPWVRRNGEKRAKNKIKLQRRASLATDGVAEPEGGMEGGGSDSLTPPEEFGEAGRVA